MANNLTSKKLTTLSVYCKCCSLVVRLESDAAGRLKGAGFASSVNVDEDHRDCWRFTGLDCDAAKYILHHVGGRMRHIIRQEIDLMENAGTASVKRLHPG